MRPLLPLLVFTIAAAAGCGTGTYDHKIELTIKDPSRRLGPEPIEVSIFNTTGSSEEWARRTIGTTGTGKPYNGVTWSTDTKMAYDRTPPANLDAGLFLPGLRQEGYYLLKIRPIAGTDQTTALTWASFHVRTNEDDTVPPLPAHFRSEAARKGWTIHLTVDVPPGEAKKP